MSTSTACAPAPQVLAGCAGACEAVAAETALLSDDSAPRSSSSALQSSRAFCRSSLNWLSLSVATAVSALAWLAGGPADEAAAIMQAGLKASCVL